MQMASSRSSIREYYGRVLSSSDDLRTGACCSTDRIPAVLRPLLDRVHPDIRDRFYGCGVPIPSALEGTTVLDLGCGTGRDTYILSQLVGPDGRVIGVDMTPEQLDLARRHQAWHAEQFGHGRSNVEFRLGYMEKLGELGIEDGSIDVVVSNCVFNLSPDKPRLFREVMRVLRQGGELHFSDVFADRRIPASLRNDPVLLGECLSGAMYEEDFRRLMASLECPDVRELGRKPVELVDPGIEKKIGMVSFHSRTLRAFKIALDDRCEDYGQVAAYRGTIPGAPHRFELDPGHVFQTGRPERVCGNTAEMLTATRLSDHFEVSGDRSRHHGLFECGPVPIAPATAGDACC